MSVFESCLGSVFLEQWYSSCGSDSFCGRPETTVTLLIQVLIIPPSSKSVAWNILYLPRAGSWKLLVYKVFTMQKGRGKGWTQTKNQTSRRVKTTLYWTNMWKNKFLMHWTTPKFARIIRKTFKIAKMHYGVFQSERRINCQWYWICTNKTNP